MTAAGPRYQGRSPGRLPRTTDADPNGSSSRCRPRTLEHR
jgi:hypothetical protein